MEPGIRWAGSGCSIEKGLLAWGRIRLWQGGPEQKEDLLLSTLYEELSCRASAS